MPQVTLVNDIATMKGLDPLVHPLVWIKSYRGTYPGGGGLLRWDSTVTSGENEGTIFTSTLMNPPPDRWIRDIVTDALDFGADPRVDYNDLTNAPHSADAFARYRKWAQDNDQAIVLPQGVFYLETLETLVDNLGVPKPVFWLTNRTVIQGAGMQNTILVINPELTAGDVVLIEDAWRVAGLANALEYGADARQGITIRDLSMVSRAKLEPTGGAPTHYVKNPGVRGIVTQGRVDELRLYNVQLAWLGTALSFSFETILENGKLFALVRESSFFNVHVLHCGLMDAGGSPLMAAVDIRTTDALADTDGTNSLFWNMSSIVFPEGIGLNIENPAKLTNPSCVQVNKMRRFRFVNMQLQGSSPKNTTQKPRGTIMRILGDVDNLDLISAGLSGSTIQQEVQNCIELNGVTVPVENSTGQCVDTTFIPISHRFLADLRGCEGRGLYVGRSNNMLGDFTVEQATMGSLGEDAAVQFVFEEEIDSIGDSQTAVVHAMSSYAGTASNPPGARVEIAPQVRQSVVVERAAGEIVGAHVQRSAKTVTAQYNDDTLVVETNISRTITLPALAELTVGKTLFVMDGWGNAQNRNVTILPSGTDQIESLSPNEVKITTNWGKQAFRSIEVGGLRRWLTWAL